MSKTIITDSLDFNRLIYKEKSIGTITYAPLESNQISYILRGIASYLKDNNDEDHKSIFSWIMTNGTGFSFMKQFFPVLCEIAGMDEPDMNRFVPENGNITPGDRIIFISRINGELAFYEVSYMTIEPTKSFGRNTAHTILS